MANALQTRERAAAMRNREIQFLRRPRMRNRLALAGLIVLVLVAAGSIIAAHHWPFTQAAVAAALGETVPGQVHIAAFHPTYFPGPGCVAEGVVITGSSTQEGPVVVMVQKLTIETGFM